ncbi:uncharacterized protein B0I36DRAFT_331628 [Microdochium trichocladiopsis]|uniref:Uncharacterized protein n=1 Tax=Microdochium trichocladiopsis TaxID=1682393 RepID=A0A9P8Y0G5_9PEZI|nr:uncharacterized protein B0I36DRAFT_331628 [Microdochium trichocladiopsis]KAH7024562.1 hypothetical protein B0I36DRAFT_331628 [Microdochium trichocladiopsis]
MRMLWKHVGGRKIERFQARLAVLRLVAEVRATSGDLGLCVKLDVKLEMLWAVVSSLEEGGFLHRCADCCLCERGAVRRTRGRTVDGCAR